MKEIIMKEIMNLKGVSKGLAEEIEKILESNLKKSSRKIYPENETREDGTYVYCKWHRRHEHIDHMAMKGGKAQNECRAAVSAWSRKSNVIKKLESELTEKVIKGEEGLEALGTEIKVLRSKLNNPEDYDWASDWAAYKPKKK